MKKTKIAINGFGRIGRSAFKIAMTKPELEVVAINDLTDNKILAYLLQNDSNYGRYHKEISYDDRSITVGGQRIKTFSERDPIELPWKKLGIDVVIESTGRFVTYDKASRHLNAGAKKVVISAPAKDDDHKVKTIVMGVNDLELKPEDKIISNASCTTNCLSPVVRVIEDHFGIDKAMMTTVHSYTASQVLQDGPSKNERDSRAAAENIIPTTTGATKATGKVIPSIEGRFTGLSIRVPTPVVSLCDTVFLLKSKATVEQVNQVLEKASRTRRFQRVLATTREQLVSSDFIGDSHSAIVDFNLTQVVGENMLKLVAWYDNEWGYSNRLVEVVQKLGNV
ncbi:type I glyceraldehyde-3-phosphate dehydrogenase [Candidatus Saccharibacteria bacterium]|nr:type I glyceraldehyde-3-phosphate dehydrogenase [Candidatus Saccharibacteria bacterium]